MHGVPTHFIAELELLESIREHEADPSRFPLPKGMLEGETFDFSSLRTGLTRYVAVTRCSQALWEYDSPRSSSYHHFLSLAAAVGPPCRLH